MGGSQFVGTLPRGVDRLPFRFVPRVGEALRRADDAHQRERAFFSSPQVGFEPVGFRLAEALAAKEYGGGHRAVGAVVVAPLRTLYLAAPVLAPHRAVFAQRVGVEAGNPVAVGNTDFRVAERFDFRFGHDGIGQAAQGADAVFDAKFGRGEPGRVDGPAQVDFLLPFQHGACGFHREPQRTDALKDAAHTFAAAPFAGSAAQQRPDPERFAPDHQPQFAVGHRRRSVAGRVAGTEGPPVVLRRGAERQKPQKQGAKTFYIIHSQE